MLSDTDLTVSENQIRVFMILSHLFLIQQKMQHYSPECFSQVWQKKYEFLLISELKYHHLRVERPTLKIEKKPSFSLVN